MSAVLARAKTLVGTPFRLQGRDPGHGIDCVGLVVLACAINDAPRPDYRRRGEHFACFIERSAPWLRRVSSKAARVGDIVLLHCGTRSWHVGIFTQDGLIHADPSAGRVVFRPGDLPGTLRAVLRRRLPKSKRD